jgi:hypothetical protein
MDLPDGCVAPTRPMRGTRRAMSSTEPNDRRSQWPISCSCLHDRRFVLHGARVATDVELFVGDTSLGEAFAFSDCVDSRLANVHYRWFVRSQRVAARHDVVCTRSNRLFSLT